MWKKQSIKKTNKVRMYINSSDTNKLNSAFKALSRKNQETTHRIPEKTAYSSLQ